MANNPHVWGFSYMCKPKAYDLSGSGGVFFTKVSWIATYRNQTFHSYTKLKSQRCLATDIVLQSLPLSFLNLSVLSSRMFLIYLLSNWSKWVSVL